MFILRIAWRNLWRNPARTAITGGAIAVNTAVLIVCIGLSRGMVDTTIKNLTSLALGEAEVHAPRYREERSLYNFIRQPERVLRAAKARGLDAAPRSFGPGLASIGQKSSGALFWGVNPEAERKGFELPAAIAQGRFLAASPAVPGPDQQPVHEVVLGRKLANALAAGPGSDLVAVVQAADGSLGNDLFHVVGILKSVSSDVDRSAALIHEQDFANLFVTGGRIHEIALSSHGRLPSEAIVAAIRPAAGDLEVLSWQKLAPAAAQMLELLSSFVLLVGLVFALTAGTGVMNGTLMSTFDRLHEFGLVKALGATPWRVLREVGSEALLLGMVFGGFGALLGAAGDTFLARHGLNLGTGHDLLIAGVAYDPVWRSSPSLGAVLASWVVMCVASVAAALYPAAKAARLDPVVAMNEP
jgi:ABC-type lipoprotein release transport system permease subunit